jgi:hypothetical protein
MEPSAIPHRICGKPREIQRNCRKTSAKSIIIVFRGMELETATKQPSNRLGRLREVQHSRAKNPIFSSVAVLMAVRYQLFCIWLRITASDASGISIL